MKIHVSYSIPGALMNWRTKMWVKMLKNKDDKFMTPTEVKLYFLECLEKGVKYLPVEDCDNFDYKKGCLGHES